jgi:hypothetical protein
MGENVLEPNLIYEKTTIINVRVFLYPLLEVHEMQGVLVALDRCYRSVITFTVQCIRSIEKLGI